MELDGVHHDVSLFSQEGQQLFAALLENNQRLKKAETDVVLFKASAITLIAKLKEEASEESKLLEPITPAKL
tara:strand:- start:4406 stop:4621 length:216 start_codon:yes stop_codon:yes gene_type:complete